MTPPVTIVIPARLGSTRFPAKVLADRTGKPLIQHVHEAAARSRFGSRIAIATDDARVADAVRAFGGRAVMTSPDHPSGTSRLAEAADLLRLADDELVVNVQGDEPELEPAIIDASVDALLAAGTPMATAATPLTSAADAANPNIVKVVRRRDGRALYFSRSPIPFVREPAAPPHEPPLRHVGLYVYRRHFLRTYAALEPTLLERTEMLEQLRVLYHGHDIAVALCPSAGGPGVDTPEQYEAFVARYLALRRG